MTSRVIGQDVEWSEADEANLRAFLSPTTYTPARVFTEEEKEAERIRNDARMGVLIRRRAARAMERSREQDPSIFDAIQDGREQAFLEIYNAFSEEERARYDALSDETKDALWDHEVTRHGAPNHERYVAQTPVRTCTMQNRAM
jgi:hypothetical protein